MGPLCDRKAIFRGRSQEDMEAKISEVHTVEDIT